MRNEYEQGVAWFRKGAEAGSPRAMRSLGYRLRDGDGVAAPDYPAAADWMRLAADGGDGTAASALADMYAIGCGLAWPRMPATSLPQS